MGCCLTTTAGRNSQLGSQSLNFNHSERAPPPSIEEETVKEVLSETPKLIKPPPEQEDAEDKNKKNRNAHIDPTSFLDDEKKRPNEMKFIFREEETVSEKENSEVCSLSISETLSNVTFDYCCNDDEGEVKQRVKKSLAAKLPARNRSISGGFGPKRDRVAGKSPNRRTDQSPDKRRNAGRGVGGSVKSGQTRESLGAYQAGSRGLRPDPYRKDPGEGSGRRSRSPATNRSTMGRSPSARKTNGSPGQVRADLREKWPSTSATTPNESLENPLVSLECFIFL